MTLAAAASVSATIPIIVVILFFQKHLVKLVGRRREGLKSFAQNGICETVRLSANQLTISVSR